MTRKLTKGRQKVPIVKMEKKSNLQVTFSKRRNGLFKKASELCTLTGAEVGLVVFSPGQKAYSFGHPSFESMVNKYLGKNHVAELDQNVDENLGELNKELAELEKSLEFERRRRKVLNRENEGQPKFWWQGSIGDLNDLEELQDFLNALERPKKVIEKEMNRRRIQASNLPQFLFERGVFGGNVGGPSNAGPSGFSAVGGMVPDFNPATIDLNARVNGIAGCSNMHHGTSEPYVHKFF